MMQELSALEVLQVDDVVETIKSGLGLDKDNFVLSANFEEFELDSTDVLKNLQMISSDDSSDSEGSSKNEYILR